MIVSISVAHDEDGVIGKDGSMPWHLPSDLARFKSLTMGKPIIMGRRTYESIGRPLPGRTSIVISGREGLAIEGAKVLGSLSRALDAARETGADEAFIIGGGMVYEEAVGIADKAYVTLIHARFKGDTFFPTLPSSDWTLVEDSRMSADEKNPHDHSFLVFERA